LNVSRCPPPLPRLVGTRIKRNGLFRLSGAPPAGPTCVPGLACNCGGPHVSRPTASIFPVGKKILLLRAPPCTKGAAPFLLIH